MEQELIPLSLDDTFSFSCHDKVSCFNECCRDLNQFLTPYDILRLKDHLKLRSNEFLKKYTMQHMGPETGLPVIVLRQNPNEDLKCPFVTDKGCSVYENRPSSCRTYPLARIASRNRETGELSEQYVAIEESHCKGFQEQHMQSVKDWIKTQGIEIYNEMNDRLMEVIALKNQYHPEPLDFKERHIFHLACYDLDTFRDQMIEQGLLDDMNITPERLESAKTDDTELLRLSLQWLKKTLFEIQ